MKDIDFDELDRAVNSLINKPASDGNTSSQSVSTGPVTSTAVPVSTSTSVPVNTSAGSAPPVASGPSPAARRSSGRFMDVVHPSSDMKPTPHANVPSREGMTISPSKDISSVTPNPMVHTEPIEKSWPDPIDLHEASQKPQAVIDAVPSIPPAQDSPFLTDAKVEKRPLGAFSDTPQSVTQTADMSLVPNANIANTSDRSDHPIETDTPLPAELQNDLLSIEDDDSHESPAPVSITQQYTEQPSTTSQPTSAIFDTEAYRKPLAHPKKKKSGWLMVMWIFILLVVGAGAGAAVYFYVLPLL